MRIGISSTTYRQKEELVEQYHKVLLKTSDTHPFVYAEIETLQQLFDFIAATDENAIITVNPAGGDPELEIYDRYRE